jgi:hypothetical protein
MLTAMLEQAATAVLNLLPSAGLVELEARTVDSSPGLLHTGTVGIDTAVPAVTELNTLPEVTCLRSVVAENRTA